MSEINQIRVTSSDLDDWFGTFDSSLVELTLKTFQRLLIRSFEKTVGNKVYYEFTPNLKQHFLLRKGQNVAPPYLTIGITSMLYQRDRMNFKAVARSGIHTKDMSGKGEPLGEDRTRGWLVETKPFPIRINAQVSYVDSDVRRMMSMGTELSLRTMLSGFTFRVGILDYAQEFEVVVGTDQPELSAPGPNNWLELDDENRTNLQVFTFPVYIDTYNAVLRKVPAFFQTSTVINNEVLATI